MAVKAKKRKLVNTTRQDQDAKVPQNKAEAELQRQEDEMLAMTRLLKRVDKKDALTVAKKILENTTTTTTLEETSESITDTTEATNGDVPTSNGTSSNPNETSDRSSNNSQEPRQSRTSNRLRQEIATNVTPSPVHGNKYAARETRSKAAATNSASTSIVTTTTTTNGNGVANGSDPKSHRGVSSVGSESETWLADLTIANIQKQNDAHDQEDQRLQEIKEANAIASIVAANESVSDGVTPSNPKRPFVSVLRSGRRRVVPLQEATDLTEPGSESNKQGQIGDSSVSVRSAHSVQSDTSSSLVASIISESFGSSNLNAVPNISVTFKPGSEGDPGSLKVPGFEIPISALIQPRLTKTLIQQKARSTYAPPNLNQTEQPRRKPGRPPGYFLGPTSCAYCRAQHRRCDFNTVCIRCIKAKIPCDRSGTVDRPTIIVREARQQAKAEAAAALAAAVAAGLAIAPEKPRPANRYSQLHALTMEAASITSKLSSPPPPESTPSAGTKRRRSPSPSDVSRGNIIEQKVKRVASVNPIQKYDPSAYLKPHNKANGVKARKLVNGESSKGYTSSSEVMSTGSHSGSTSDAGPSNSSAGQKRKPGRPATKYEESIQPAIKRSVGRPPNSVKYALNPSLIPQPKLKRKPGRPPKSTAGASTSVVPSKRSRSSSKNARGKASSYTKNSKGKQVAEDSEADEESDATNNEPEKPSVRLVRKIYLKSGLYSADLKVNPVNNSKLSVTLKQTSKQVSKNPQTSKALVSQNKRPSRAGSSQSGPFFQLPINYGAVLISTEKDFCLPFDIMQAWQAGLLRKTIQPEPFIKIRSNIFLERKRRTETSPMVCHCTPPPPGAGRVGCGEDCYNRVMFYECVSAHCPCGDQCSNQRFQRKHKEDHLRVIWTQERGFGIQTLAPIKKGNLVIEYRGEVISQSECHRRMETIYKNNKNFYFLEYEKGEVVDACQKGTNARFVNHSCSPNSQIEKWFLNGEMSIGIFASQDIPAGAEISYDYNFSSFSGAQKQKCRCGAPNCRGYIGERISKNKEPAPAVQSSGRSGKKTDTRKRKAGRRKVNDQEPNSIRLTQMPSVRQIRQRQSDKYKEDKMAAIRYTKLFLFRNIRLVESKYIKYARTKSRSYQETVSRSWLMQARQCRKRSLEGVVDDLRAAAKEQEEEEFREQREESNSVGGDDGSPVPSISVSADENSIMLELDAEDADAMDEYDDENSEDEEQEDEIDELEEDGNENTAKIIGELEEEDELEEDELEVDEIQDEEDEVDELESEND
ncbi:Histone-Lysine N-Methyltransferase ash1l [Entomortierella chlamydospora]|nr:Histone-Lysine N-Methyltransferase ash1l [Entomortierella chlamydospora]